MDTEEVLTDCIALDISVEPNNEYKVEVLYRPQTQIEELLEYAKKVLICAGEGTSKKADLWNALSKAANKEEYVKIVNETDLVKEGLKCRLKETL